MITTLGNAFTLTSIAWDLIGESAFRASCLQQKKKNFLFSRLRKNAFLFPADVDQTSPGIGEEKKNNG